MQYRSMNNTDGAVLIITVVVLGVAALIMALNATLLGIGSLDLGYTSQQHSETVSLADACVEEALYRLRNNNSFSGATLSLGSGQCILSVTPSGLNRTIHVTATIDTITAVVVVESILGADTSITVTSWQEQ